MSLGREERLKALGLWPVWRLRDATDEAEAPAVAAEPAGVRALSPSPSPSTGPDRRAQDAAEWRPGAERGMDRRPAEACAPALERVNGELAGSPSVPVSGGLTSLGWDELRQAVETCTRCPLHETRTKAVFGVGDAQADWLIVGEAPGADEDRQGEPFVGQAGRLLDAMLAGIGQKRGTNVYIANVLKSRPPGNRDPKPEEVAACIPYLERQIELIRPKIILALGRFAAQSLLLTEASISRLRGRVHEYCGVPMVVTYHPAYLLRNPADKAKAWEDLCLARNTLQSASSSS